MTRVGKGTIATIPALLRHWAETTPGAPALAAPGRKALPYGALAEQTVTIARQLARSGIGRHDRVALVHDNGPELAASFLAVSAAAVCAPLNTGYRLSELEFYISHLGATAVMLEEGASAQVRRLAQQRGLRVVDVSRHPSGAAGRIELASAKAGRWHPPGPDDTALVLHTSGTTARPKIVPLSHGVLTLSATNIARTLALGPHDRCLNVMPLFHIHGLVGALLSSLRAGACVVCAPGFQAPLFHAWLSELAPTWYTAVPTMHQAVLSRLPANERPADTSLRFVRSSSASLPPQVHDELEATFGVPVIESYGMTEAAHQVTSNPLPPGGRRRGSVGVPHDLELAVLDDEGTISSSGAGEVVIRGETVFRGYESNPEANGEAFVEGWFRTGDQGIVGADGYVTLVGRTKEIVNRAGEKISPGEVEDALLAHPDVVQAVSFAVPDARLGEVVGAAVVPRAGAEPTERELQSHVASRLAAFKVPSVVLTLDDFPVGPTGKVQRIGLAERLGLMETQVVVGRPAFTAPRSELEREIAAVWVSTLGVESVGVDDDFFSLGGDSILGAEVVARLGELTGHDLPLTTLMWAPTVGEFAALIEEGSWDEDARVVPVRTEGSQLPLFVIHGLWDEVLNIGALKRTLSEEQPLYAVRIVPHRFPYRSVEEMASDYLREIKAVQPSGPYQFASLCSGGLVVAELTRQAHAAGVDVALAAVIDPRSDMGRGPARHYVHQAIQHVHEGTLGLAVRRELRHWLAHVMPRTFPDPELEVNPLRPRLYSLRRHCRLHRIPGTFTVISTMDYKTPKSFWDERADRVTWYEVDAPHHTIFQQPHADALGQVLAHVLRDVDVREEVV